jgi:hypothetical protein
MILAMALLLTSWAWIIILLAIGRQIGKMNTRLKILEQRRVVWKYD